MTHNTTFLLTVSISISLAALCHTCNAMAAGQARPEPEPPSLDQKEDAFPRRPKTIPTPGSGQHKRLLQTPPEDEPPVLQRR